MADGSGMRALVESEGTGGSWTYRGVTDLTPCASGGRGQDPGEVAVSVPSVPEARRDSSWPGPGSDTSCGSAGGSFPTECWAFLRYAWLMQMLVWP